MFVFFFENVAVSAKEGTDKSTELLKYLDGKAFVFFNSQFTKDEVLVEYGTDFENVKKSLIGAFKAQEEHQYIIRKAMVASSDPGNLTASMQSMAAYYRKAEFNEKSKYVLLNQWAVKVKEWSVFIIYRTPKAYQELMEVIKDY